MHPENGKLSLDNNRHHDRCTTRDEVAVFRELATECLHEFSAFYARIGHDS